MSLLQKSYIDGTFDNTVSVESKELSRMLDALNSASKIYVPSDFWQDLNTKHVKHISAYGLKYFKRSINNNYFDWGPTGIIPYQLSHIFSEIRRNNFTPLTSEFIDDQHSWKPFYKFQILSKFIYRIYVAYMYDYVSRIDHLNILKKISEPRFGSPLLIKYRGKYISQNLCNSTQEFYSITKEINLDKKLEIAEIGAGYGRLAYVFLKTLPSVNYCIIDIPPALYISQEYLKKIFPKEKFFFFKQFDNYKNIERDFRSSRIKFLMPHQLEYLPKESFDIMINISSFHEMRRDQIKNYIKQVDRLSKGYFFLKQSKKSVVGDNSFIQENEYPIPAKWRKVYHHTDPIHSLFFEAMYKTR